MKYLEKVFSRSSTKWNYKKVQSFRFQVPSLAVSIDFIAVNELNIHGETPFPFGDGLGMGLFLSKFIVHFSYYGLVF